VCVCVCVSDESP